MSDKNVVWILSTDPRTKRELRERARVLKVEEKSVLVEFIEGECDGLRMWVMRNSGNDPYEPWRMES